MRLPRPVPYLVLAVSGAVVALVLLSISGGFRWELIVVALTAAVALSVVWMLRSRMAKTLTIFKESALELFEPSLPTPRSLVFDLNPARIEQADILVQEGRQALACMEREKAYRYFSAAVELDFTNAAAWLGKSLASRSRIERRICLERARRIDLAHSFACNHVPRWDTPIAEQIARGLTLRDLLPLYGLVIPVTSSNNGLSRRRKYRAISHWIKKCLEEIEAPFEGEA